MVSSALRLMFYLKSLLACLGIAFLFYAPALKVGFLSDDWGFAYLARETPVAQTASFFVQADRFGNGAGNYRPLASVLSALVWKPLLQQPEILHAISIFLFAVIAWLIGILFYRLFQRKDGALIAGLSFLFLPLNVETVVWLSNWNGLFSILFLLISLILYSNREKPSAARYAAIGITLLVSLSAKEFALLFPLLAIGIDLLLERTIQWKLVILSVSLSFVYFVTRFQVLGGLGGYANTAPLTWNTNAIRSYLLTSTAYLFHFFHTRATPSILKAISLIVVNAFALTSAALVLFSKESRFKKPFFVFIGLIYVSAILGFNLLNPAHPDLAHSRLFILSNVFFCLLVGYCFTLNSSRWFKALPVAFVLCLAILLPFQLTPWKQAGIASQRILEELRTDEIREASTIAIKNLPDNFQGAFIFRNGIEYATALMTNTKKGEKNFVKTYQDQQLLVQMNDRPRFNAFAK